MSANPLEQFEVKTIIPIEVNGIDISFTNSSLFMAVAVFLSTFLLLLCVRKKQVIPGYAQSIAETLYDFINGIVKDNIGSDGKKYFAFIFTIFLFVLTGNLLGLIPLGLVSLHPFTYTSHLAAVGTLSLISLIFSICVGIKHKGWGYLHTFFPKGIPLILAPLIVLIEIISFASKPFSLTVRLVANMTVGHVMLDIIAGFVLMIGVAGAFAPIIFNSCIIAFEFMVAFIQAFIYTVLTCVYLGESLHDH